MEGEFVKKTTNISQWVLIYKVAVFRVSAEIKDVSVVSECANDNDREIVRKIKCAVYFSKESLYIVWNSYSW